MKQHDDAASRHSTRPIGAPGFFCPSCECPLTFQESRENGRGDNPGELSDIYQCPAGCGTFEYERHRHRLRLLEAGYSDTSTA